MIAVQTETLVGLIGLGGAVIGFAGAVGGAWIQQAYGAKAAKLERTEQRALASGETAINELLQLGQVLEASIPQGLSGQEWMGSVRVHLRQAEVAVSVIPNSDELRYRMTRLFFLMRGQYTDEGGLEMARFTYYRASRHGVEVLAAFQRGDALPEEESWIEPKVQARLNEFPGMRLP
ncbi:hypothetical protein ACFVNB_08960 [Streptomyces rochei]|uniref:hypothetical protein n=1 Tax=Streptomyces rochei TaxID=1928 RepID=UPI0036C04F75